MMQNEVVPPQQRGRRHVMGVGWCPESADSAAAVRAEDGKCIV